MEEKEKKKRFKSFTVDESTYKTYTTKKFDERKPWEPDNPFKMVSFIPGTILKIFVKEGQEVKKGDPLLILEAMKMENEIMAEIDAKVKKIHAKVGDKIPKDYLYIEFE
jgi:biotin carboxyl carrier protein